MFKAFKKHADKNYFINLKNVFILILVLIDLILLIGFTFFVENIEILYFISVFDLFVCIVLFFNLIYEYYESNQTLISFLKNNLIDIISMIPFSFIFFRFFAVLRVLRILQILKIIHLSKIEQGSFGFFVKHQFLEIIFIVLIFYIFMSSFMLTQIDYSFNNLGDAIWFNIVTMSGVGYGDVIPTTDLSRLMSITSIIAGVIFVSVFTAAMSSVYMKKPQERIFKSLVKQMNKRKNENKKILERMDKIDEDIDKLNTKLDEIIDKLNKDK